MKTYDAIVIGAGPGGYPAPFGSASLAEGALHREGVGRRRLPQLGLHPVQGADLDAAHLFEKPQASARDGHRGQQRRARPERDAGLERRHRQEADRRRRAAAQGQRRRADRAARRRSPARRPSRSRTPKGGTETFRPTKGIVIATGSPTIEIPRLQVRRQNASSARSEAVEPARVPKRLVVIGGGVIGLELGMVYQSFGSELTVVEALPEPAHRRRSRLHQGRRAHASLKRGGTIHEGARRSATRSRADGSLVGEAHRWTARARRSTCDVRARRRRHAPEHEGPRPRAGRRHRSISAASSRPTSWRAPTSRRSTPIGDVSGPPMLAHKATKEGEVVAEVIAGHKAGDGLGHRSRRDLHRSGDRHGRPHRGRGEGEGHRGQGRQVPLRGARASAMAISETDGLREGRRRHEDEAGPRRPHRRPGGEHHDQRGRRSRSRWRPSPTTSRSRSTRTRPSARR